MSFQVWLVLSDSDQHQSSGGEACHRRSEGDIIRVLVAARSLPLARDALLAAALAATLLAFSRHAADQPVLASRDATAVLLQLLQVRGRHLRSLQCLFLTFTDGPFQNPSRT